jgi:hypothetical protein
MDDEHVLDLYLLAYVVVAAALAALRWPPFYLAASMHCLVLLLAIARTSEGFGGAEEQYALGLVHTLSQCRSRIEDGLSAVVSKLRQSQAAASSAEAAAGHALITRDAYRKYQDPDMARAFPVDEREPGFTLDPADEARFDALAKEYALLDRWMDGLPPEARAAIEKKF